MSRLCACLIVCCLTLALPPATGGEFAQEPKREPAENIQSADPQQLLERGERELRAGALEAAIESFSAAIRQDPRFTAAYAARARAYRRLEAAATTVEERDRAAIGYISDEQHVGKSKATPLVLRELDEYVTNRLFAIVVIYTTAWLAVFYMLWYQGKPVGSAGAICLVIHVVTWLVPILPVRYGLGPAALVCVVIVALLRKDDEPAPQEHSGSALEAAVREQESRSPRGSPDEYAVTSKNCPSCSREVSEVTRVCPRCSHRF